MMTWEMLHPQMTREHLGLLPYFFDENDPDPAKEQINKNYAHGGGFRPMRGFSLKMNKVLRYPGDPPLFPLARSKLRDELIMFYDCAILAIIQPDGSFEVCRVD